MNAQIGHDSQPSGTVDAIPFGTRTAGTGDPHAGRSWRNRDREVTSILRVHAFDRQQGSDCFGNGDVNAVSCVIAVRDVARRLEWFSASVRDIRMLRIEEFDDLSPAFGAG